jgi:sulfane dehydrogenase subunit SoxC
VSLILKDLEGVGLTKMSEDILNPRRRGLLAGAASLTAGLFASRRAVSAETNVTAIPDWTKTQGAPIDSPPYGVPSPFEKDVVRRARAGVNFPFPTAAYSDTPFHQLHGIITPAGLHYERHHAGVPAIDPDQHELLIHGLVDRPLIFSMEDIMRFPSVSRLHFLECSGNTQGWANAKKEWTAQDTHGLLSCSEWTGVLLSTVLAEAGVKPQAKWVLAEGADAAAMTRSIPIGKALDDAILAYAQNGERLRPEQGYPLRLFLPGFEGNMSVKWLRRLKLGEQPWFSREETSKYTGLLPDGKAVSFNFVMDVKSVITFPSGGQQLNGHGFHEITGLAWSGLGKVSKVEVSVDGGSSWREAQLEEPILSKCLTRFRLPWTWDGGPAVFQSRATDEFGNLQPTHEALVAKRGTQFYYHYNGIQAWRLETDGALSYAV